jgi:hypothetical protein
MRPRLQWFAVIAACCIACGPPKPTRASVSEPISQALRQQVQVMTLQTPEGCFTFIHGASFEGRYDVLNDDRQGNITAPTRELLKKEQGLGLVDVSYSVTDSPTPEQVPPGCVDAVKDAKGVLLIWSTGRRVEGFKTVQWKVHPSRKATAAGVSGNQSIAYAERNLVAISGLIYQDATTTLVEYSWEWRPTDVGLKLGLKYDGNGSGRAVFRKYDDGWRLDGVDL